MTLAERVRAFLHTVKRADAKPIENRADARRYLRAKGPWQHFTADPHEQRTRQPGRSRVKRNEQRERVK